MVDEHVDGSIVLRFQFYPRGGYIRSNFGNVENDLKCGDSRFRVVFAKFRTFSIFVELKLRRFVGSPSSNPPSRLM